MGLKSVVYLDFNLLQQYETYLREEKQLSEKTIKSYLHDLGLFEKYLETIKQGLGNLTRIDVQNYINHLKKENKNIASIHRYFTSIKSFCEFIKNDEACARIRIPKQQKTTGIGFDTLSKLQLNDVLRASLVTKKKKRNTADIRKTAIIYLLAYTGIRVEELTNLNISDVELKDKGKITVLGKGNKVRRVPLLKDARDYIKDYLETRNDNEPALFVSNYGKRMDVRSVQRLVKTVGEIYNVGKSEEDKINLHPHIFRHSYARMMIKDLGMDIITVSQLMGHSSVETTMKYAMDSMADISEKLDNFTI